MSSHISRIPRNITNPMYEIVSVNVGSWCPLPDGKGSATQVHMVLNMAEIPYPFVMRFKTPEAVDRLIAALERHRADVWPTHKG